MSRVCACVCLCTMIVRLFSGRRAGLARGLATRVEARIHPPGIGIPKEHREGSLVEPIIKKNIYRLRMTRWADGPLSRPSTLLVKARDRHERVRETHTGEPSANMSLGPPEWRSALASFPLLAPSTTEQVS